MPNKYPCVRLNPNPCIFTQQLRNKSIPQDPIFPASAILKPIHLNLKAVCLATNGLGTLGARLLAKLSDSFAALCSQAPLKPSDEADGK